MPITKSLSVNLKKIVNPDVKAHIKKRFKILHEDLLTTDMDMSEDKIPSLDECYKLLGKAYIRRDFVKELNRIIMEHGSSYTHIYIWSEELHSLHKSCCEQVNLLKKMIHCYLFKHKDLSPKAQ